MRCLKGLRQEHNDLSQAGDTAIIAILTHVWDDKQALMDGVPASTVF